MITIFQNIINYKYSWVGFILVASVGVAFFNLWQSKSELSFINLLIAITGFISIGSMFWIAYHTAPNFIICWMISFVVTAICTVSIDVLLLHQIEYTTKLIIGFIVISIGVIIMK